MPFLWLRIINSLTKLKQNDCCQRSLKSYFLDNGRKSGKTEEKKMEEDKNLVRFVLNVLCIVYPNYICIDYEIGQ